MYYLMNKDAVAASFHKENSRWMLLRQDAELPLGRFEINTWLEDRKAYKHNRHLKRLMIDNPLRMRDHGRIHKDYACRVHQ